MSAVFQTAVDKVKGSFWSIIFFCLAGFGLYIAINLYIEDYNTTLAAYAMFPTHKVNPNIIDLAAWLPQLAPLLFGFAFMRDTKKKGFGVLALSFMILDMITDWYFKGYGLSQEWQIVALLESFMLYTIGSEVLILVTFELCLELIRPAVIQSAKMVGSIVDGVSELYNEMFVKEGQPQRQFQQPQQQQRPPQDVRPAPHREEERDPRMPPFRGNG